MNPVLTKEMAEFNRLYKETGQIYTRYAASHKISTTTLYVLYSLYTADTPCTQAQLVEDWGIPPQTVNSCLQTLKKNGTVHLEFSEGNRKSKCILLTKQGWEIANRIVAPMVAAENQALEVLETAERQQLLALTRKHSHLLQTYLLKKD